VFVAAITIVSELVPSIKDWLKDLSGHHWTTKSIFSLAVYAFGLILIYLMPKQLQINTIRNSTIALLLITAVGVISVFSFYTLHFIKIL